MAAEFDQPKVNFTSVMALCNKESAREQQERSQREADTFKNCLEAVRSPSSLPPSPRIIRVALHPATLHPTPFTLHHAPHTIHPTPNTLPPTPHCVLHPTPYHPTL